MKKNLSTFSRVLRAGGGLALLLCSVMAPLPLLVRIAGLGGMGAYLLFTALAGSCLGYTLLGMSCCPIESKR